MANEILAEARISLNSLIEYSHTSTGSSAPTEPAEGDIWYQTNDSGNTEAIKQYSTIPAHYIQQTETSTYNSSVTYYVLGTDGTYSAVTVTETEFNANKTNYYIYQEETSEWTDIPLTGGALVDGSVTNSKLSEHCVQVPNLAIGQYMTFYSDVGKNKGTMIVLGGLDSSYKVAISSDWGVEFYSGMTDEQTIVDGSAQNTSRVAYINGDQLYINKAVVVSAMEISDYRWEGKKVTNTDGTTTTLLELKYTKS